VRRFGSDPLYVQTGCVFPCKPRMRKTNNRQSDNVVCAHPAFYCLCSCLSVSLLPPIHPSRKTWIDRSVYIPSLRSSVAAMWSGLFGLSPPTPPFPVPDPRQSSGFVSRQEQLSLPSLSNSHLSSQMRFSAQPHIRTCRWHLLVLLCDHSPLAFHLPVTVLDPALRAETTCCRHGDHCVFKCVHVRSTPQPTTFLLWEILTISRDLCQQKTRSGCWSGYFLYCKSSRGLSNRVCGMSTQLGTG